MTAARDLVLARYHVEHGELSTPQREALSTLLAVAHREATRGHVPTVVSAAVLVAVDRLVPAAAA